MSGTSIAISCAMCRGDLGSQQFYIKEQYTAETILIGPICSDCYTEFKAALREVDGGKD